MQVAGQGGQVKLDTHLELSAPEIESAITGYARSRTTNPDDFDFHTRVLWSARKAIVEVRRKPTLADTAEGGK
jgi:hypothetical protein